jgi:hypothetical protein
MVTGEMHKSWSVVCVFSQHLSSRVLLAIGEIASPALLAAFALVLTLDGRPESVGAQAAPATSNRTTGLDLIFTAAADTQSTRSAPPDTTPYTRPAVPEDYAPGGKPAISPDCPKAYPEHRDATKESPPKNSFARCKHGKEKSNAIRN